MKLQWNLTELEKTNEEKTITEIKKYSKKILSYKKKKIEPSDLHFILKLKEKMNIRFSNLFALQTLKISKNTEDTKALSKLTTYEQLSNEISEQVRYVTIWFSKIKDDEAKKYLEDTNLQEYKYYLENIRKNKKYILDEDKENIISIKSMTGAGKISDLYELITTRFEFDFQGKKVTQEQVISSYHDPNPKIREQAYKTILGKYKTESVLLTEIYKAIALDWYNEGVRIRKHKDSISIRNNGNDLTDKAVSALLNVCEKNSDVFSSYFKLKHKLNKGKYPHSRYHLYAPLSKKKKKYSFDDSKKIVLTTFKDFHEKMYVGAKSVFDSGHIDSHPAKNKRGGAYSYSPTSKQTPWVMLNHTDTIKDVFTMIHELGHAIHTVAAFKQNEYNFSANLPLSETASIFSENLLAHKLLKESKDDEEKAEILREIIDSEYASIGRQSFFVLFEKSAHKAILEGKTKEELDEIYYSLLKKQFKTMKIPSEFKHEWNYIPHIYRTPFYCYAYAWGNLLVLSLWKMYLEEGESFKEKYWKLLSCGGSENPQKLLKQMGIDVEKESFWLKGFEVIKKQIAEFEKLTSKN